jgi:hypothetical protein
MVIVAQLVRASDCGSEGRGFETPHSPFKFETLQDILKGFFMEYTVTAYNPLSDQ